VKSVLLPSIGIKFVASATSIIKATLLAPSLAAAYNGSATLRIRPIMLRTVAKVTPFSCGFSTSALLGCETFLRLGASVVLRNLPPNPINNSTIEVIMHADRAPNSKAKRVTFEVGKSSAMDSTSRLVVDGFIGVGVVFS